MSLSSRLKKLERAAADPSRKFCACPGHKEPECRWIKLGDPDPEPEYCPDCGKQRNLYVYAFYYSEAVGPVLEPESDDWHPAEQMSPLQLWPATRHHST